MIPRVLLAGVGMAAGVLGAATGLGRAGQTAVSPADAHAAHVQGRNYLGALIYCWRKGHVDLDAVSAMRETLARLPPTAEEEDLIHAEDLGREGIVVERGVQTRIDEAAVKRNITPAAICQRFADSVKAGERRRAADTR